MNYFNPAAMRALGYPAANRSALSLASRVHVQPLREVLPMSSSISPRPCRTVSLACAIAFTLIAAPCVYAQSGTPAGGAVVAHERTQSARDIAGGKLRDAASRGDLAEVERLLKAGADVNAKTRAA